jgi:hypothetical protein
MSVLEPTALLDRWRTEAQIFERFGQDAQARMIRRFVADLESWWDSRAREMVTVEEAVEISGYSRSALEQMRRDRKLSEVGPGRFLAGELPRKPQLLDTGEPNIAALVLESRERGL